MYTPLAIVYIIVIQYCRILEDLHLHASDVNKCPSIASSYDS